MLAEVDPVCAAADVSTCFHCGEAAPAGIAWKASIAGRERPFCCAGCLAVARTIDAAGLAPFYAQRTAGASAGTRASDDDSPERHAARAVAAGLVVPVATGEHE